MSNELKTSGFCKDCPYVELIFDKCTFYDMDERPTESAVTVECEHEQACQRIVRHCGGNWV